jgi:hypothetical protein
MKEKIFAAFFIPAKLYLIVLLLLGVIQTNAAHAVNHVNVTREAAFVVNVSMLPPGFYVIRLSKDRRFAAKNSLKNNSLN